MNKFYWILFSIFFYTSHLFALTGEELFKNYSDAVVKIKIAQQGIFVGFGTGFFIKDDGTILTNYHVVAPGFQPGFSLSIETKDGVKHTDVQVGKCSDVSQIDLCILKIKYKPKAWISKINSEPRQGAKVFVIGHPKGYDYTISEGMLSGLRGKAGGAKANSVVSITADKDEGPFQIIQISAPISPGNSGGPIFYDDGSLAGVATWVSLLEGVQNINFGLSGNEIIAFCAHPSKFYSVQAMTSAIQEVKTKVADDISNGILKSVWDEISAAEKSKNTYMPIKNTYYKGVVASFFNKKYFFQLPKDMLCENSPEKSGVESASIICTMAGGVGVIKIGALKIGVGAPDIITALDGKNTHKPQPLPIVQDMIKNNTWNNYKKTLNEKQLKYLHSFQVKPSVCRKHENPNAGFWIHKKGNMSCRTYFLFYVSKILRLDSHASYIPKVSLENYANILTASHLMFSYNYSTYYF